MESAPFSVRDWLPTSPKPATAVPDTPNGSSTVEQDIEAIVSRIEASQTDITTDYDHWVQIGFALAHELGEIGRSYFHRLSKFFPQYDYEKTNLKYSNCLKNRHAGVTIKTFFYLAKQAGITIATEKKNLTPEKESANELIETEPSHCFETPLLPAEVYDNLPLLLKESSSLFAQGIERDIYLLSALTVLSACLPNIEGIYFNRNLSAHLYLFITGPSASGKGTMIWSRYLAQAIHEDMINQTITEQTVFTQQLEDYENLPKTQKAGMSKPEEPNRRMLFIPANSSSAALIQLLYENNFSGIIFESEADTLSQTAKQDWGDSSDIFRKAFHHENTSMARRLKRELIEITNPHLAICLSGTPKQVHNLMPDVENGLFSRFMYYAFQDTRGFLNPFVSHQPINYHEYFTQKSYEVFHLREKLLRLEKPVHFQLTEEQGEHFTRYFQTLLDKNKTLLVRDLDANTKRLGVISFRLAMVLSALRLMDNEIGKPLAKKIICTEQDYQNAMTIAGTLESHAVAIYQQMPQVTMNGKRLVFYEKLPGKFNRRDYMAVAKELGISLKTAEKYLAVFNNKLITHSFNEYSKINK